MRNDDEPRNDGIKTAQTEHLAAVVRRARMKILFAVVRACTTCVVRPYPLSMGGVDRPDGTGSGRGRSTRNVRWPRCYGGGAGALHLTDAPRRRRATIGYFVFRELVV